MAEPHLFRARVYFEDTDAAGIIYHASFLKFAERARTEMLRDAGFAHADMVADGRAFVVRWMEIDFRKAGRLDQLLEVASEATVLKGARLSLRQCISDVETGAMLALLDVQLACIDMATGRPARVPHAVRALLRGDA